MKKFFLGACAMIMTCAVSCTNDEAAEGPNISKELTDSISIYSGQNLGYYILSDYMNYIRNSDDEISKDDLLKGIQMAFANADSKGTVTGLQVGAQILNQINQYEESGIKIDRGLLFKSFRQAFMSDTVSMEDLADTNAVLTGLMNQAHEAIEKYEAEKRALEAKDAVKAAEEYIAAQKAEDPVIMTTASGLSYKIDVKGEEPFVEDESAIDVIYTGRLIDGTVFDQSKGGPATFSPRGVIPGFAEGLKMLGKGGKATFYIPGDLAYGANGVPQAGIGPNAMLVFDVEIVDVRNPE